ncbi:MAG: hypothetical protein PHX43_07290 [Alphaproteobacteria bacterium]|nr:hypothetical protein [Alphaproteobacteria bacterium]
MNSKAPRIGFDRFIQLEWVSVAINVRNGLAAPDELELLLEAANLGKEARKKTRTVLNRLWMEPRAELVDFANRGLAIYMAQKDIPVLAMCWGMAISTYPFFGKVAELVGRLTSIQGDCSSAEVHRRMCEIYGEREGTRRMANMAIQSQASWGALQRIENGKRIIRMPQTTVNNKDLIAWLLESALRCVGTPVSMSSIQSLPMLFPFLMDQPLAYVVSNSPNLDIRSDGTSNQFVSLHNTI